MNKSDTAIALATIYDLATVDPNAARNISAETAKSLPYVSWFFASLAKCDSIQDRLPEIEETILRIYNSADKPTRASVRSKVSDPIRLMLESRDADVRRSDARNKYREHMDRKINDNPDYDSCPEATKYYDDLYRRKRK